MNFKKGIYNIIFGIIGHESMKKKMHAVKPR